MAKAMMSIVPLRRPDRDPGNMSGPLINAKQRERVLGYIEKGKAEGRTWLVGGGAPAAVRQGLLRGAHLFADVDPDSTIAQEEIFGPVLAVIPFEDDDDAVRIANDSRLRAVRRGQWLRRGAGSSVSPGASAPGRLR